MITFSCFSFTVPRMRRIDDVTYISFHHHDYFLHSKVMYVKSINNHLQKGYFFIINWPESINQAKVNSSKHHNPYSCVEAMKIII